MWWWLNAAGPLQLSATITGFNNSKSITVNYVFAAFESLQSRSASAMPWISTTTKHAIYTLYKVAWCSWHIQVPWKQARKNLDMLQCSGLLIEIGIWIHIISRTRWGQFFLNPSLISVITEKLNLSLIYLVRLHHMYNLFATK